MTEPVSTARPVMLRVNTTSRDGEPEINLVNVADIAAIKPRCDKQGGTIIERNSTSYAVWSTDGVDEIFQKLRHAGVDVL